VTGFRDSDVEIWGSLPYSWSVTWNFMVQLRQLVDVFVTRTSRVDPRGVDVGCVATERYLNRVTVTSSISVCPCQLLLHQLALIIFIHLLSPQLNPSTENIAIHKNRGGRNFMLLTALYLFVYFFTKC
jgi:hypothetical protein